MNQSEWLADIGGAADDLGYGILHLEPSRIELAPVRGDRDYNARVVIETIVLSGGYLRRVLLPLGDGKKP